MDQNSNAIITLCSHLCVGEGVVPLEPREWNALAQKLLSANRQPEDLFSFTPDELADLLGSDGDEAGRILRLIDRSASLCFELERYRGAGINVVTRADEDYPQALKKKLANGCPPIFYYAGDISISGRECVGYVGARTVSAGDVDFTKSAVRKTASPDCGVVSGGARGIDTVSETEALLAGSFVIEYLSDSMLKRLKSSDTVKRIQSGKILLMSVVKPDSGFSVGTAMMRNRYIYAQSVGTVVVHSDLNKGGTWAGANDGLTHGWCPVLCWDHPYPGNQALIEKGALPIGGDWDGRVPIAAKADSGDGSYVQTSLFDQ